jgi:hypothetical protein
MASIHLQLQPLVPATRVVFERHQARAPRPLSAYALTAHLLWQDHFTFYWAEVGDHFFLFAAYDGHLYMPLPPLPSPDPGMVAACFDLMNARNRHPGISRIENIAEEDAPFYRAMGFALLPKDPEYLYARSALVDLQGNRHKTARWACNHFVRHHSSPHPTDRCYLPSDLPACLNLWRRWRSRRSNPDRVYQQMLDDSESVHRRMLTETETLGLTGWVIEIGGELVGYTFGFPLSRDLFCIASEVADPDHSGAAAYLFRAFCRALSDYEWINTMDDSGLENLRRAKERYRPDRRAASFLAREIE